MFKSDLMCRKPVGKTFGATVDLWSIGVTCYHVATGTVYCYTRMYPVDIVHTVALIRLLKYSTE